MRKFNLYYGVKQEGFKPYKIEDVEFVSVMEAKQEAREYAEDLYMQNPIRDILEIMKEENVGEEIAHLRFKNDMLRNTIYSIEERVIVEDILDLIPHGMGRKM